MRGLVISFYVLAASAMGMGFYKMFAYKNYDPEKYPFLAKDNVNAYVGADAYNYVINGTYATSFFVLFGAFLVAGLLVEIMNKINKFAPKQKK